MGRLWRLSGVEQALPATARRCAPGLALVYVAFFAVFATQIRFLRIGDVVEPMGNPNVAEAQSWLEGHVDLNGRPWDSALVDGRSYNIFPPLLTFVSAACIALSAKGLPFAVISALFVLPVPLFAYLLFLKRTHSVSAATVMAMTFVLGTSECLVIARSMQSGKPCQLNNAASQIGLLLFLLDYYGGRRPWVGGLGLLVMGLTRQTMLAFTVPYLWGIWDRHACLRRLLAGIAIVGLILAILAAVTTVRFGHPLRFSYKAIYVERSHDPQDWLAVEGTEALFGLRYVSRNLYWMNVGLPEFATHQDGSFWWKPAVKSTGIWWTTPVLLVLFVDWRRVWAQGENRWLSVSVGAIFITLMLYHNMGYSQRGYNRFSLDFLLVLLAWVAPHVVGRWRSLAATLFCAWSVFYFRFIVY